MENIFQEKIILQFKIYFLEAALDQRNYKKIWNLNFNVEFRRRGPWLRLGLICNNIGLVCVSSKIFVM